jgi:hypothetical protein
MAFDPVAGEALRLGGSLTGHPNGACTPVANESTYRSGSWTAFGGNASLPPALAGEAMVWDNATGSIFLFGGTLPGGGSCPGLNETWAFSAGSWTNLTSYGNSTPSGRSEIALADDGVDQQVVLFGGVSTSQGYIGDTWVWVGPSTSGGGSGGGGGGGGSGGGQPIRAGETESTSQGALPLTVQFSVTTSGGAQPYRFEWNFGDGVSAGGPEEVTHPYVAAGSFQPSVLITDAVGHTLTMKFPTVVVLSNAQSDRLPPSLVSGPGPVTYVSLLALGALAGAVVCVGVLGTVLRNRRLREEGEELVRPRQPGGPR